MGTGIFFLPAVGAKAAGPASLIAWLALSILSIYIAMCFAELASMFAKAGGIYEFCKQAYGRFASFIIGWTTMIAGNITIAMLVVGAIQYLLPDGSNLVKILISLMFILIFNAVAFSGMKTSAAMLITFAFITLGTLLALIVPGIFKFNATHFSPFLTASTSTLFFTVFLIAETFFGWETATFLAEETKDGQKVMPKALIVGTVLIALICLLFVITSIGVMPASVFGDSVAPLTDLGILHYGIFGGSVFTILVYLAIIGSVAGWVVSAPRLLLAMAKDKLFPKNFAEIHHKFKTPYKAIILQTIFSSILVVVGAGSYTTMLHLLVPVVLLLYCFVILTVPILRYKQPNTKRYFTVPFGKSFPYAIVAILLSLIVVWFTHTEGAYQVLSLAMSLIILGIPIYFLIEMYYDAPAIRRVNEYLSYPLLLFENILFPVGSRSTLLKYAGPLKGKKVLEYGCGVGTLTKRLAKQVLPGGHVYAYDMVAHNVKVAERHLAHLAHVHLHHHPHLHHFKIGNSQPKVDLLISAAALSYMQKPQTVLKHLANHLKKGGKVVFLDYDKFFFVIPNVYWIQDHNYLTRIFKNANLNVTIIKKRHLFWESIYIVGEKK
tara:strand:- start:1833 stop:3650 length:1818 start_codon:yes stop_codon:yes gene_type:complete